MIDSPGTMIARINELLRTKQYDWAKETLIGIRDSIQRTQRVTLRQQEAVEHIMVGRLKHHGRNW